MTDDVHEPLELYHTVFREAHARHTSEFFERLVRKSGVDEQQNEKTVKRLRELQRAVDGESTSRKWWILLRGIAITGLVLGLCYVLVQHPWPWLAAPALVFAPLIYKLNQKVSDASSALRRLESQRDEKRDEAWQQLAPLNRLYGWDIVAKLVQQTVPRLALDPYFANGRLDDLRQTFGWDDAFNQGRSIVFAHSGELNGNPFVLAQTQEHWMGEKIYQGSLNISWTERVRKSDGGWTTETRHQTLHASVKKPYPEYGNRTFIIYGNEAAPALSFSRTPSDLSGLEDGAINNWRKRRAIKQLEAKGRDLREGRGFTVMANREFEALFGSNDRDHEVEFRLLFTPLAQQEMLKLLKDTAVGYGDDFEFVKRRKINIIEPGHMGAADIGANPERFRCYELAEARRRFNDYHNDFFRSLYFGIAPLLAIPLYQQYRSPVDIYKSEHARRSSFWEHEAIANHYGHDRFRHPECVTQCILKTRTDLTPGGAQTVRVTAYGYRSVAGTSHVSMRGGDGRNHDVRVDWVEFFEVQRESNMLVQEQAPAREDGEVTTALEENAAWKATLGEAGVEAKDTLVRRCIVSGVMPHGR